MISPALWHAMDIGRIAFMLCFLPVLLYRIWRLWRYPASAPAVAITAFCLVMWFWLFMLSDFWWRTLPSAVRATSLGGLLVTILAACTQIFVLGISGSTSPERVRRGRRVILVVTAIVLAVVVVSANQSPVLLETKGLHELTNALLDGGDRWAIVSSVVGNGYLAVSLAQLIWTGLRHADRTPVGTGLGLLAVAASFEIVAVVVGGVVRPLTGGRDVISGRYGVLVQGVSGSVGVTLLALGFLWPPVVLRLRARRDEWRLRPLHDTLADMFPGLFPPLETRMRLSDKVFEWGTHVQDGLTLLAHSRGVPLDSGARVPKNRSERSFAVANWLVGQPIPGFSSEWLHAPEAVDDQAWVLAIADAYRRYQKDLSAEGEGSERERLPVKR
ncbi:hypothetical protein DE4585_00406 [Mycobacteroides salmoniphilum]|uniref:Uncharacterized protein n=1 Tax=Mycobacteroides salmoniphilum TaxID=404941 RepID=A0A4R8S9W7_9MYCO|nr:hypothetical protein [Mycobacteroides salmoniphilum]TDZ80489.1 hypothetical protein DE4586_00426 [Mycobacteroides salmoniphilum]TDZ87412.1 hypothetical protein DE4585_00406 [Mycobacteroides salmoniphilum]TDZ87989.1 hypothetical protein DE4587_00342 [Mycobacteroides salmoniphilum]